MKTLKISILVCLAIIISGMVNAQKIKLVSGNLDFLKGQKVLKVEYNYEDMYVGKEKEEDYIKIKVIDYNFDEPGKGDKWREAWFNDRTDRFQPKFELLLNKYLKNSGVTIRPENEDAKYTLLLKTTMIEPGFFIGSGIRKTTKINTEAIFIKTDNPDKELAKIVITKSPSSAEWARDFDVGYRIMKAYAKCGKELGKYLSKKAF